MHGHDEASQFTSVHSSVIRRFGGRIMKRMSISYTDLNGEYRTDVYDDVQLLKRASALRIADANKRRGTYFEAPLKQLLQYQVGYNDKKIVFDLADCMTDGSWHIILDI